MHFLDKTIASSKSDEVVKYRRDDSELTTMHDVNEYQIAPEKVTIQNLNEFTKGGMTTREACIDIIETYYKKCLNENHPSEVDLSDVAYFYNAAGETEKAKKFYIKAAESWRKPGRAIVYPGLYYKLAGEPEKSKECWLDAVETSISTGNYGAAGLYYEHLGMTDKAKEMWLNAIDQRIAAGDYKNLSFYYEKLEMHDKACESTLTYTEKLVAAGEHRLAAECYEKAGMTNKARGCWLKLAEELVAEGLYNNAAEYCEKVGTMDGASECYIKIADGFVVTGEPIRAIGYYKRANISLTTLPKESQEKLLGLVREGNVAITRGLAKLVETEEDEIIFNEARAGLVL